MTALHLWLIALGAGLAAGPVILHLLMQEKPKRMVFPALRFVLQKQYVALRSMRLRHWLLLLLRVAVIALVALALSRPAAATALFGGYILLGVTLLSGVFFLFLTLFWRNRSGQVDGTVPVRSGVRSAQQRSWNRSWPLILLSFIVAGHVVAAGYLGLQLASGDDGPVLSGKQPVTAAIVVDTSPRMNYRYNNQSRLQQAQEMAHAILEQLPAGSQLAILDSSPESPGLSLDLAAAGQQIDSLQTSFQSVNLVQRAKAALELLDDSPLDNRELYLISDLTRPSWTSAGSQPRLQLDDRDGMVYLVDVGMKSYDNWSVSAWNMPNPSITPGGVFKVNCTISRQAVEGGEEDLVQAVAADHLSKDGEGSDTPEATMDSSTDGGPLVTAEGSSREPETRTVRLLIEKPQPGRPVHRNGETLTSTEFWERFTQVTLAPGQSMEVGFQVANLPKGEHQAWVEIVGGDALPFDNQRYMTVRVEDAWQALVVNGPGVKEANLVEAISPTELREAGQTSFACKVIEAPEMETLVLSDYRVVFLLDPAPLDDNQWRLLQRYVKNGGSLAVFLGHNALSSVGQKATVDPAFQTTLARELLPGRLEDPWRSPEGQLALDPIAWDHPIFSRMKDLRTQFIWGRLPVFMHFGLRIEGQSDPTDDTAEDQSADSPGPGANGESGPPQSGDRSDSPAPDRTLPASRDTDSTLRAVRVLATFTNNMPAICETTYGQGQVITLTTPITDPVRPEDRRPWNSFMVDIGDWSFMYYLLINEISEYLATSQASSLNGFVGESFFLSSDSLDSPGRFALFRPNNQEPIEIPVEKGRVFVDFTRQPGSYRLSGLNTQNEPVQRGFSVNVATGISELTRIGKSQLDSILGKGHYLVAETEDQIVRNQGQGRVGLEFYPSLIRFLAILFLCELMFSNFFYRSPPTSGPTT